MTLATTSIEASGGTTVPTTTPTARVSAQRSSLTGGLRSSLSVSGKFVLDGRKGFDLLYGRRSYAGDVLERIRPFLQKHTCYLEAVSGWLDLKAEHPVDPVALLFGEALQRLENHRSHVLE